VLVGFMGAGKSSTARMLAAELGVQPFDSDREIERELGDRGLLRPRGRVGLPRS
jgi:shikimate kinase